MVVSLSCTNSHEKKTIEIEEIELNIENTGLSSYRPFFFSNDLNKMYLFDDFNNVFFEFNHEKSSLTEVLSLVAEDRFNVSEMHAFLYCNSSLYIFSPNQIILYNVKNEDVQKDKIDELIDHNTGDYVDFGYKIQFNLNFGKNIAAFDSSNSKVYFLMKNNSELRVAEYSLLERNKIRFLDVIDNKLIDKYRLSSNYNSNISIQNVVNPILSIENNKLIISYPFMNSFEVYDFIKEEKKLYSISSQMHSNFKIKQILKSDEISELMARTKDWNNDITFGPIFWDKHNEIYYRLIKGESTKLNPFDGGIFLSIFNQDFELIEEKQLNNNNPDLTYEYFKMDSSLYVRQLSNKENDLKYLKINFTN